MKSLTTKSAAPRFKCCLKYFLILLKYLRSIINKCITISILYHYIILYYAAAV